MPEKIVRTAVKEVLFKNMSLRQAAARFGIKKSTLHDRVSKARNMEDNSDSGTEMTPNNSGLSKYPNFHQQHRKQVRGKPVGSLDLADQGFTRHHLKRRESKN